MQPSRSHPLLLLALLALATALLWLSADSIQAQTPAEQTVPSNWEHIPAGIEPGDSFRLLFVTSATRDASSTDIADYNAFVQTAAGGNDSIKPFKGKFTALISTATVDARDNTATTGTGVPIHWLGGERVADDYADLYDKDWDSVSGKTEGGDSYTGLVWTGGNKAGEKSGQRYAGADEVRLGDLSDATLPLSSPQAAASSETHPLYALSPVITVAQPEPEPTPTPAPEEAQAPKQLRFHSIDGGWAVISGAADDEIGQVRARGVPKTRIRYQIEGHDAFSIDRRSGRVSYDGAPISAEQVSLTVTARDSKGEAESVSRVLTVAVSVDEAGSVSLQWDGESPQAGSELSAILLDPDGGVTNVTWAWERSPDGSGEWEAIAGAASETYTPTNEDAGYYLRATAYYADGHGPGKSAASAAAGPVLGVIQPPTQPVGQPQVTTVWSATLTVDKVSNAHGCDNAFTSLDNCSSSSVLTDDDFSYGGTDYAITQLRWDSNINLLILDFGTLTGSQIKTALSSLTLNVDNTATQNVDGTALAVSSATMASNDAFIHWAYDPATDWADGNTVSLSLTAPTTVPAMPTGLKAAAGAGQVTLTWDDPMDSSITKYQVWHRPAASMSGGSWADIPHSGAGTTSHTVTGLTPGVRYRFWIRPVNSAGTPRLVTPVTATAGSAMANKAPDALTGLSAQPFGPGTTSSVGQITLTWHNPNDLSITKYEICVSAPSGCDTSTQVEDIPGSGSDTTSHVVTRITGPGGTDLAIGTGYRVIIRAVNMLGSSDWTMAVDATPTDGGPTIESVEITSSPAAATGYKQGEVIDITATFSRPVKVTGNPFIKIDLGGSTKKAWAEGQPKPNQILFRYQVRSLDTDANGIIIPADAITLFSPDNIWSAKGRYGPSADLSHAAVTGGSGHKVKATGDPDITQVGIWSNPASRRVYRAGETIVLFASTNPDLVNLKVTRPPQMKFNIGNVEKKADYARTFGGTILLFEYTVTAADLDADGIGIPDDPIVLAAVDSTTTPATPAGKITHDVTTRSGSTTTTTATDLSLKVAGELDNPYHQVDGSAGYAVRHIEFSSSPERDHGYYLQGDTIEVVAYFSGNVVVDTTSGTPTLDLHIGHFVRKAAYHRTDGSRVYFRYTVQANDVDHRGVRIANKPIELNGGRIANSGVSPEVNANLDHPGQERWERFYWIEYDTSDQKVDGSPGASPPPPRKRAPQPTPPPEPTTSAQVIRAREVRTNLAETQTLKMTVGKSGVIGRVDNPLTGVSGTNPGSARYSLSLGPFEVVGHGLSQKGAWPDRMGFSINSSTGDITYDGRTRSGFTHAQHAFTFGEGERINKVRLRVRITWPDSELLEGSAIKTVVVWIYPPE